MYCEYVRFYVAEKPIFGFNRALCIVNNDKDIVYLSKNTVLIEHYVL